MTVLQNGNFARVPVLLGSARDEVKLFMFIGDHSIQRIFGLPIRLRDPRRYQLLAEYGSPLRATIVSIPLSEREAEIIASATRDEFKMLTAVCSLCETV